MFLENYNNSSIVCKMLKLALSESLHNFLDNYGLSFAEWNDKKDEIDGRSQEKIFELLELVAGAIESYPKDREIYLPPNVAIININPTTKAPIKPYNIRIVIIVAAIMTPIKIVISDLEKFKSNK